MNRVSVNPELLCWARERAVIAQEELLAKFKKLPQWETGEMQPTLKQLEAFARAVHVPFGYLFLSGASRRTPADCRLPHRRGHGKGTASPDLIDTLYAMQRRQAWLREPPLENRYGAIDVCRERPACRRPRSGGSRNARALGLEKSWAQESALGRMP